MTKQTSTPTAASANTGRCAIRGSAFRHSSFELRHSPAAFRHSPTRRSAFTLVEVLVVITIIGVLVVMLLPALGKARDESKRVLCKSMFHHLQVATNAYAADHRDEAPWLNSGEYGSLGIAGPGGIPWWITPAQAPGFIAPDPFVRWCTDYLNAAWRYDAPTASIVVPKAIVCPGIQPGKQIHSWMPGHPTGKYEIGEGSWGGNIVGFGSFLGLYCECCSVDRTGSGFIGINGRYRSRVTDTGPQVGVGRFANLRLSDFKNPSAETIFIDMLMQRGGASTAAATAWNIPHGGSNGLPAGINQGFADGSVRWFSHSQMNWYFQPDYAWDRQILTPMYVDTVSSKFQMGGYPEQWGWAPTTPDWYGITTPCSYGNYQP